jgi:hypothetical protein
MRGDHIMKRKAIVGIELLLVTLFLAGCGGISQKDYDAVIAERDTAQVQIATIQNQLDAVQKNLIAANTEIADLETLIADIEKAAAETTEEKTETGGTSGSETTLTAVYTNSDYGFSLEYPNDWAEMTQNLGPSVVARIGEGTYFIPAVRIIIREETEGTTLLEVFTAHLTADGNKAIDNFTASNVTINGTNFTQAEVTYHGAYGAYDSLIIGLVKNGKWIIIEVYTLSSFPFSDEGTKTKIINSVTFK